VSDCALCAAGGGLYLVSRTCCAMRLLHSTPKHGARQAMWLHLKMSLTAEQWESLRAAWSRNGPGTP
jgi:hypothetical protein